MTLNSYSTELLTAVKIIARYDITTVNSCTNREVWQLKLKMFALVTEGHRNWHQSTPLFCRPRNFLLLFHSHWVYSLCLDSFLWPPYGIGQAIIFLSCGFFYLPFFLAYSQPSQVGRLPYFHTWCGPSANLECRSEMCCMRLAGNAERKKSPKFRHLRTIAQLCRAISSQLRHILAIGKTFVKQQYLLHMCS